MEIQPNERPSDAAEQPLSPSPPPTQVKLPYLPAEIRLPILKEFLRMILPHMQKIHSDRWPIYRKMRLVDLALTTPGLMEMFPEALYSNRVVVVKPVTVFKSDWKTSILYPMPAINHWVTELEFHPNVRHDCDDSTFQQQIQWLRRLASGVLGFQKLNVLRLAFAAKPPRIPWGDFDSDVPEFLKKFEKEARLDGPFRFRAKKLEILFEGDARTESTKYWTARIMAIMSVHQDPVPSVPAEVSTTSTSTHQDPVPSVPATSITSTSVHQDPIPSSPPETQTHATTSTAPQEPPA